MKSNKNYTHDHDNFLNHSSILRAGMLSALLTLGGCGGGGGGGGGGLAPTASPIVVPTLETATSSDVVVGFNSPFAVDPEANQLLSVEQTVIGAGAVSGILTITVSNIILPDGNEESGFVVALDLASTGATLGNDPLDGLIGPLNSPLGGAPCIGCVKSLPPVQSTGGPVTFIYLDPSSLGLNFSTLGMWSKPTTFSPTTWLEVGGAFSAGVRAINLPANGTADYEGFFIGRYATSTPETTEGGINVPAGTYIVGANANATARFGAGTVDFSTQNTQISGVLGQPGPVTEERLNITRTGLTINPGSRSFGGNLGPTTNDFDMGGGEIKGGFYGPPVGPIAAPQELGGSLAVGDNNRGVVGSFGLTQQ